LLAFLLVSRNQTFTANFDIPNEGMAHAPTPKQIGTDVDSRAARPKFDECA
jgi:hypothetical protein